MPRKNDEGEPQTQFLLPAKGGSYRKNADNSLTRTSGKPTSAEAKEAAKPRATKARASAKRVEKATEPAKVPDVPAASDK